MHESLKNQITPRREEQERRETGEAMKEEWRKGRGAQGKKKFIIKLNKQHRHFFIAWKYFNNVVNEWVFIYNNKKQQMYNFFIFHFYIISSEIRAKHNKEGDKKKKATFVIVALGARHRQINMKIKGWVREEMRMNLFVVQWMTPKL